MRSSARTKGRAIVRATGLLGLLAFLPLTLKLGAKSDQPPVDIAVTEACASGKCCFQLGSTCTMGGQSDHIYTLGNCPPFP